MSREFAGHQNARPAQGSMSQSEATSPGCLRAATQAPGATSSPPAAGDDSPSTPEESQKRTDRSPARYPTPSPHRRPTTTRHHPSRPEPTEVSERPAHAARGERPSCDERSSPWTSMQKRLWRARHAPGCADQRSDATRRPSLPTDGTPPCGRGRCSGQPPASLRDAASPTCPAPGSSWARRRQAKQRPDGQPAERRRPAEKLRPPQRPQPESPQRLRAPNGHRHSPRPWHRRSARCSLRHSPKFPSRCAPRRSLRIPSRCALQRPPKFPGRCAR